MSERVEWIDHRGKKVLYVDFSGLKITEEMTQVITETKNAVLTGNEVLILFNIVDSRGNPQVIAEFKQFLNDTKTNIKRTSVYCTSNIHKIFLKSIRAFTSLDLQDFDTLDSAKDYLTD